MNNTYSTIIVAAGSSRRMQGQDKLWIPLAGRLTIARTIDIFDASPLVDRIVLVLNEERVADAAALCEQEGRLVAYLLSFIARSTSRLASRVLMASRRSCCFLPDAFRGPEPGRGGARIAGGFGAVGTFGAPGETMVPATQAAKWA